MTSSSAVRYLRLTALRDHADSQLLQMARIRLARRSGHRIHPRLVLREGDRVPEVLLTGQDHDVEVRHGLQLGADWYVPKPFSPADIVTLTRRFLGETKGSSQ